MQIVNIRNIDHKYKRAMKYILENVLKWEKENDNNGADKFWAKYRLQTF
jgi:hypothetical protein